MSAGPYRYAIANGITSRSLVPGEYQGKSEFRIRSLGSAPAVVRQRIKFSNRDPVDLEPLEIQPWDAPYQEFPRDLPEEVRDAGPWGAVIESTAPLAFLHIGLGGRNGQSAERAFGGGCAMHLASSQLSRSWAFPDSFRMVVAPEGEFPFSQYEWYHVLNPWPGPVEVVIEAGDGDYRAVRKAVLPGERVLFIDEPNLHDRMCCWVTISASEPILAQAERVIYGPSGPMEWGVVIGCHSPGAPLG